MKINIIENNKTLYHIVHSVLSSECERYACMELQKYIYNSTNTLIPVSLINVIKDQKKLLLVLQEIVI